MKLLLSAVLLATFTVSSALAGGITPPPEGARVIDFDDLIPAEFYFVNTTALRDRYAALGVTFSAPGSDGGAILDSGSLTFGVTDFSPPNFLAFADNGGQTLAGGGSPVMPETLIFRRPVSHVQFNAGSPIGTGFTAEAFNSDGDSVATANIVAASALATVTLAAPGIVRVVLTWSGGVLVLDDLAFVLDATLIDFDDLDPAPMLFSETTALRGRYSALGVRFSGPGNDGGAILDDQFLSAFVPHSGPNVLAFFDTALGDLSGGGRARLPQILLFSFPVRRVEFQVGDDQEGTITAEAFDAGDKLLGSVSVSATQTLQPVVLEARGIAKVVIATTTVQAVTVIDDLSFLADGTMIDFDDYDPAPSAFADALPLRDRYAALGIEFSGDSENNGGAILDKSGTDSVTGFSAPNALAFALGGTLWNSGKAKLPETLHFDPPIRHLQFRFGAAFEAEITAEAFDATDTSIGSSTIPINSSLQSLDLDAPGAVRIQISSNGSSGLLDDLFFTPVDPCVHAICDTGAPLDSTCDGCATKICAQDDYCCTTSWDTLCTGAVGETCGVPDCPKPVCTHSICAAGDALVSGCDPCVTTVCDADPTCCSEGWDTACMLKTISLCSSGCEVCGDANHNGAITAGDALIALKAAIGDGVCIVERCDFNGDLQVKASDALAILKTAVGQATNPQCPSV